MRFFLIFIELMLSVDLCLFPCWLMMSPAVREVQKWGCFTWLKLLLSFPIFIQGKLVLSSKYVFTYMRDTLLPYLRKPESWNSQEVDSCRVVIGISIGKHENVRAFQEWTDFQTAGESSENRLRTTTPLWLWHDAGQRCVEIIRVVIGSRPYIWKTFVVP